MRLEKNGVPYELTADDKQAVQQAFQRFPISITYPSRYNPVNGGKTKYLPKSLGIPLTNISIDTGKYAGNWTCYRTKRKLNKDLEVYDRESITDFKGALVLGHSKQTTDWELVFFLYFIHPLCENGLYHKNHPEATFMFNQPGEAAKQAVMSRKHRRELEDIIFNIDEAACRSVCIALGKQDSRDETVSLDELQKYLLDTVVDTNNPDAIEKFNRVLREDVWRDVLGVITEAEGLNVISYAPSSKKWYILTPGETPTFVCHVQDESKRNQTRNVYIFNHPELHEKLQDAVAKKKDEIELNRQVVDADRNVQPVKKNRGGKQG